MNFKGKKILVTGSTTGIGRGAAEMFLEAGATVVINGRTDAAVAKAVTELGPRALPVAGDVATVAGCCDVVQRAIAALGGLDCLVNNVGICPLSRLMDVTEEHWDQVIDVNLRSALFCTKFALPTLRQSNGNVVMVASVGGITAGPTDSFVYAISKGAMIQMTKGLALELAPSNVRVNAVCPGYIDTPMIQAENEATNGQIHEFIRNVVPLRRIGTVREIASAILYLASDYASYAIGTILVYDGGCAANASWGGANAGEPPTGGPAAYVPTPVSG